MKNIIKIVSAICLIFQLFPLNNAFAKVDSFSDVSAFHPSFTAIQYLLDEKVVSGFSDGTFGPEKNITRCEFLKILMRASKVEMEELDEKSFPDVEENFWCNQYAYSAKRRGVVSGDDRGFFWPQRNISRIEALKILYLTRQVNLQSINTGTDAFLDVPSASWYRPYVVKAISSNIIGESKAGVFGINQPLKRSEMAELIYRLLALEANDKDVYNSDLVPPLGFLGLSDEVIETKITESPLLTFDSLLSPIKSNISKKYFDEIELENDLPRTFVWHEVYNVKGKLNNLQESQVTIFLNRKSDGKQYTFVGNVKNGVFEIPINFKTSGTFNLGIIPGLSGISNVMEIVVLPEKDSLNKIDAIADGLNVSVGDTGDAVFSWDNKGKKLSKIVIKQGEKQIVKIISNGQNHYIPDYVEFKNFNEGKVYFAVFLADASLNSAYSRNSSWGRASSTKEFEAVTHNYFVHEEDILKFNSKIPFAFDLGQRLKIQGSTKEDLRPEIALIQPNGFVKEIKLSTSQLIQKDANLNIDIIPAPTDFEVTIPLMTRGVYFIEINYKNGLAGFNSPIYVGDIIPLIPDFRDLDNELPVVTKAEVENGLELLRQRLLLTINKDREKYGLTKVSLNDNLNLFAQTHSDDMAKNNYFSHLDQNNQGPGIRKKMFGIETPVGENLAKARNLTAIHQGLMRSAIHRDNIMRDDWTEVGLGISIDKEGYLLVVQEFSTSLLTENDLEQIRTDFYSYIEEKRRFFSLESLFVNKLGEEIANSWSQKMVTKNFFDFETPDGTESLQKMVQASGFQNSFSTLILSGGDLDTLKEGLDKSKKIYGNSDWTQVAVGLDLFPNGLEIRATVIFFAN